MPTNNRIRGHCDSKDDIFGRRKTIILTINIIWN